MDGNELAGKALAKQINDLQDENARLKKYEPKPMQFSLTAMFWAVVIAVGLGALASSARSSSYPHDRSPYLRD